MFRKNGMLYPVLLNKDSWPLLLAGTNQDEYA